MHARNAKPEIRRDGTLVAADECDAKQETLVNLGLSTRTSSSHARRKSNCWNGGVGEGRIAA